MSTSPAEVNVEGGTTTGGGRSRNAQAQADLRARRKTYIQDLEIKNDHLCQDNEKMKQEKRYFQEQIGLLKGQVKTLKESLGMRKTATSSTTVDSLLAAVEVERSKVKRLRDAIREMALMEAQDSSDSEQEDCIRKRVRTSSSSSSASASSSLSLRKDNLMVSKARADAVPNLKVDNESIATLTTSSLSPPTPALIDPMRSLACSQWVDAKPQQPTPCIEEEQDTSRSALTLLLAQSSSFKRQVVNVLAHDLQTLNPMTDWVQWQTSPAASKIDKTGLQHNPEIKVHDEILDRFFSSISSSSDPIQTRTSDDRRGLYCSASIFLVLFPFLLRLNWRRKEERGMMK